MKQKLIEAYLKKKRPDLYAAAGGEVPDDNMVMQDAQNDDPEPIDVAPDADVTDPTTDQSDDESPPAAPAAPPSDADKSAAVMAAIQDKYAKAADRSGVDAAQETADRRNLISHVFEGLEGMARARGVANGGQEVNHQSYAQDRLANQAAVTRAESARQSNIQGFLQQNAMQQQVLSNVMKQGTYDQQQKATQLKLDMSDPNSNVSKAKVAAAQKLFGDDPLMKDIDLTGTAASDIPMVMEVYKEKGAAAARMQVAQLRADSQANIAADRHERTTAMASSKADKDLDGDERKLSEALDPNKARAGLKAASQTKINNAEAANALIYDDQGKLKNLTPEQMGEAAQAWAGMITNKTAVADSAVTRLLPHTAEGKIADVKQWIMNEPQGANQQAFLQQMADTIKRESSVAQGQLRRAQVQSSAGFDRLKRGRPERYNAILQSAGVDPSEIDDKGQYAPKAAPSASADPSLDQLQAEKARRAAAKSKQSGGAEGGW